MTVIFQAGTLSFGVEIEHEYYMGGSDTEKLQNGIVGFGDRDGIKKSKVKTVRVSEKYCYDFVWVFDRLTTKLLCVSII